MLQRSVLGHILITLALNFIVLRYNCHLFFADKPTNSFLVLFA